MNPLNEFPIVMYEYIENMIFTKDSLGCSDAVIYNLKNEDKELLLKIEKTN